ncbi:MAG: hypothetical protein Q4B09_02750 [Lachnospiraceae bacterium]|nr:hypothetical protein [Lachnospiraceae bacterium]
MSREYDERQLESRGRAYRVGFLSTATINIAAAVAMFGDVVPLQYGPFIMEASAFIGITVFAVMTICSDSYFGKINQIKRYPVLLLIIIAVNGAALVKGTESWAPENLLTTPAANQLLLILTFSVILIAVVWKMWKERNEEDEE